MQGKKKNKKRYAAALKNGISFDSLFFFSSRRRHTRSYGDWSSDVCSSDLNARGHDCSENTVATLMKAHGIQAKTPKRFVRTTDSRHDRPVFENVLDRAFDPEGRSEERRVGKECRCRWGRAE